MLEDFVLDNLDSFDDIDTSDLDHLDSTSEDYSDFYETFTASDSFETDDLENYDGISLDNIKINDTNYNIHKNPLINGVIIKKGKKIYKKIILINN